MVRIDGNGANSICADGICTISESAICADGICTNSDFVLRCTKRPQSYGFFFKYANSRFYFRKKDLIFILTDSATLIATKCNHKIGIIWVIQKKAVSLHRFFIQRCHKYGIYRKVNSDNSITIFEH